MLLILFRCKEPEVDADVEPLTCQKTDSGMKWVINDDNQYPPDTEEQACKCIPLKIAVSEGTDLVCNTPVVPNNGFYILGENGMSNTCILLCDNYFISELTCQLAEDKTGTTWVATWENNREEVQEDCLSCWENGCPTSPSITSPPGPNA